MSFESDGSACVFVRSEKSRELWKRVHHKVEGEQKNSNQELTKAQPGCVRVLTSSHGLSDQQRPHEDLMKNGQLLGCAIIR